MDPISQFALTALSTVHDQEAIIAPLVIVAGVLVMYVGKIIQLIRFVSGKKS